MSRYAAGFVTSAGSTTLPIFALVGGTGQRIRIREIGVFNTTATSVSLRLCRLSTAGTPGTSATSFLTDQGDAAAAVGVLKNTYTSTAPTTALLGYGCVLGAAIGSGFVFTFEDNTLAISTVASSAVGMLVDSGTGQALSIYCVWQE